jgi:hypothetical protein
LHSLAFNKRHFITIPETATDNHDKVYEPPDTTSTTCKQHNQACANLANVKAMYAQRTNKNA